MANSKAYTERDKNKNGCSESMNVNELCDLHFFLLFYFVFTLISRYLAHHAGSAPDVSGCAIVSTNQDLHRTILTRLDVFGKVFVLATR